MNDAAVMDGSGEPGLSEMERVVDTFVAPSKTFKDILRSAKWWSFLTPFLLITVFSVTSAYVVGRQVGWAQVSENQINHSPNTEDRLSQLTPEARATQMALTTKITMYSTYLVPLILVVIFLLYALVIWASFNFILGARTTYGQVFAVSWYAALPYLVTSLLGIITLLAGANVDAYDIRNPVGTNLAYYLTDAPPMVRAMLTQADLIHLWSVVLTIIGMSIVAKKSIGQSAAVVVAWWLFGVGVAALGAFFS